MNFQIKTNVDIVSRSIEAYQRRIKEKIHIFLERLADIGISSADASFRTATYDGLNDVVVEATPEWIDDHSLAVTAFGNSILFIEFGTGVYNPITHPKADELGMIRGGYGKGLGKNESWIYIGESGTNGEIIKDTARGQVVRTRGNNANRCMYLAAEEMRQKIKQTAKEVFGPD